MNAIDAAPEDQPDTQDADLLDLPRHPVCTKALSLNWEILDVMLEFYEGNFIDVYTLQAQACFVWERAYFPHDAHMMIPKYVGLLRSNSPFR